MSGAIDQDHPVPAGKHVAKRTPHHFEIRTRAMDHHDGRTGGIAWPDIDDMERRAGDLDQLALRRIGALQEKHAGLRDQRQHHQRRHDNYCYH